MVYLYLQGFNHPVGGAGFLNHPLYHNPISGILNMYFQVTGNRMEQEYEICVLSCTNQPVWDGTWVFLFRSCAMLVTLSSYAYDEQTGKNLGA